MSEDKYRFDEFELCDWCGAVGALDTGNACVCHSCYARDAEGFDTNFEDEFNGEEEEAEDEYSYADV